MSELQGEMGFETPDPVIERNPQLKPASKERYSFYQLRYLFFIAAATFALGIPFISINGHGLIRLSFLHRRLEFMGIAFDTNQLYVIPFMILMFAGIILLVTSVGGRIWCGWGCPQTMFRFVYRDVIQSYILKLRSPKNKQKPLNLSKPSVLIRFIFGIILFSCVSILGTANLLWYFIEPNEFFSVVLQHPDEFPFIMFFWVFMSLFFVIDITFIQENFCKYICPYARIQSVFFDRDTALVMYDDKRGNNTDGSQGMKNFEGLRDKSGDCTDCMACVKVCPTGIDIRDGLQLGCIECLECVDACYPVMARKSKKNLINWATMNAMEGKKARVLRPRTIFYAILIAGSFIILMYLSFTRSEILLNINRTSQMYDVKADKNAVENYYMLLISNNTIEKKVISYNIQADFPVTIRRGGSEIEMDPETKVKKILTISSVLDKNVTGDKTMMGKKIIIQVIDKKKGDAVLTEEQTIFFVPNQP